VEWKDEYSIGIPEIDDQHKLLLECVARLVEAKSDPDRDLAVYFTLGELEDYVRVHFAVEEALIRMFDCPGREAHAREHSGFVEYLEAMRQSALRRDVRDELADFLRRWLVDHVLVSDRQYAGVLLAHRAGLVRRD